jgi:hypothetical protein
MQAYQGQGRDERKLRQAGRCGSSRTQVVGRRTAGRGGPSERRCSYSDIEPAMLRHNLETSFVRGVSLLLKELVHTNLRVAVELRHCPLVFGFEERGTTELHGLGAFCLL